MKFQNEVSVFFLTISLEGHRGKKSRNAGHPSFDELLLFTAFIYPTHSTVKLFSSFRRLKTTDLFNFVNYSTDYCFSNFIENGLGILQILLFQLKLFALQQNSRGLNYRHGSTFKLFSRLWTLELVFIFKTLDGFWDIQGKVLVSSLRHFSVMNESLCEPSGSRLETWFMVNSAIVSLTECFYIQTLLVLETI